MPFPSYGRLVFGPAPHFGFSHRWEVATEQGGPWRDATEDEIERIMPWVSALLSGLALKRGM